MNAAIVLLGCGHAHLAALKRWRGRPPVVVTRAARETYSGLVPAILRGEREEASMRLDRAVAAAGGRLIVGACVAIDLGAKLLRLADGRRVTFELLSLDLGAASDAPPHTIPTRPASDLPARIAEIAPGPVAIVGGGAVGVELAFCLAARGRRPVALIAPALLPDAPETIRNRAARALGRAGVVHIAGRAVACRPDGVTTDAGACHDTVAVFWAAGLAAPTLPAEAGLACDPAGFVLVDETLSSRSHPFVFAAGDMAALGVPKSGAFAVAAGAALARSLAHASAGREPPIWRPPRHALSIVGAGRGRALAWRGRVWLAGRPAWWLKAALDERWMRRLR